MKNLIAFSLLFLAFVGFAQAQNIAGTYDMTFTKGKQVFTDRKPAAQTFTGSTTFTVTQNGDEITITLQNYGGKWSTHIMKGRVGNGTFVAALPSGSKSVYMIQGRIKGNTITGEYIYARYGDGNSGIVPGWTKVTYTATRQ
ncbi:MAG: hypothetical protein AAFP08_14880 [Bacteroidota bacterium]